MFPVTFHNWPDRNPEKFCWSCDLCCSFSTLSLCVGTATATVQTNTCGCVPIKPYLWRLQFELHITLTGRNSILWGSENHLEIEEGKETMLSSWVTIANLWARSLRGAFPGAPRSQGQLLRWGCIVSTSLVLSLTPRGRRRKSLFLDYDWHRVERAKRN